MDRRSFLKFQISLAAFAPMLAGSALAQSWPSQNITLVVPFTPGGSTDILARLLGQRLGDALGKAVVIENRPGAGGSVASTAVARAAPDGHTLIMGHIGTLGVNPSLYANLQYDPIKSFSHLSMLASVHNILVVHPSLPVKNVQELIAYAKANPGKLNYATGGNGSAAHIAMAAFMVATGTEMTHVPYRGTAPAVNDLLAGVVQLTMTGAPAVLPHARAGTLRALGISSEKRLASANDIPTIAEQGVANFEASQWYGIVGPAGMPQPIIDRLNAEIRKAMTDPEIVAALAREGAEAWVTSPEELRAHIAKEIPRWAEIVKLAKIRIE
jgi:tripartite-type tricarboxylate transporter receptor subunit TctC